MREIAMEISVDVVAWYGAIVGTLAVIISGWVAWRDRARIVVTARVLPPIRPRGPNDPTKDYISINVANRGRRPKTIDLVGFKHRTSGRTKNVLAVDSASKGPQELTEGRSLSWLVEYGGIDLEDIEYAWASDQTGKEFRGKLEKI